MVLPEDLDERVERAAHDVVRALSDRDLKMSTAESLTAGMVSATIADIPGASSVLLGGAVTYSDEIKQRVLGVSDETLRRWTAVSFATAREMAAGSRRLFCSDWAVSLTGYAGPGGGTDKDPLGCVYIGLAGVETVRAERFVFEGDRSAVRKQATLKALEMLLDAAV